MPETSHATDSEFIDPVKPYAIKVNALAEKTGFHPDWIKGYSLLELTSDDPLKGIVEERRGKIVAVWDLDKTMKSGFGMHEFLKWLDENPYFRYKTGYLKPENWDLIRETKLEPRDAEKMKEMTMEERENCLKMLAMANPQGKKTEKVRILDELLEMFSYVKDGPKKPDVSKKETDKEDEIYISDELRKISQELHDQKVIAWKADPYAEYGGYLKFLKTTADLYAQMLKGFTIDMMLTFGRQFSAEDIKTSRLGHAKPLIDLFQSMGMEFEFITGTPREIMGGILDYFGIESRGNALELHIDETRRYTGKVLHNTGLLMSKAKVCDKIKKNGNKIIIAGGDSPEADAAILEAGIHADDDKDPYGVGLFFTPNEEKKPKNAFTKPIRDGVVKEIFYEEWGHEVIIEIARGLLEKVCLDPRNVWRLKAEFKQRILEMADGKRKPKPKSPPADPNQLDLFADYAKSRQAGTLQPPSEQASEEAEEESKEGIADDQTVGVAEATEGGVTDEIQLEAIAPIDDSETT